MALNQGRAVEVTGPAYWAARHDADGLTNMQLRWAYRQLRRQHDQGADVLEPLKAFADELRARGAEVPA